MPIADRSMAVLLLWFLSVTCCYVLRQYSYPRHTKYVEGYIVSSFRPFARPCVNVCVHPSGQVLTFGVNVLREVFLFAYF